VADPSKSPIPSRQLRDPLALRAIAHPVRVALLEELALSGAATATELAERVGESPANCSWHLRQLARYGFVEEAGGGQGRQRPWRAVVQSNGWSDAESDEELATAGNVAAEVLLEHEVAALRSWRAAVRQEPREWRDPPFVNTSLAWLTAAELTELSEQVRALLFAHLDRVADPSLRPPDARPIRFVAWGIPARPVKGD
jgi:DNA-binding transcriptional ArsR family regulator